MTTAPDRTDAVKEAVIAVALAAAGTALALSGDVETARLVFAGLLGYIGRRASRSDAASLLPLAFGAGAMLAF